jgi:hypothetical protein
MAFSGANNSIYIIQNNHLQVIKADKQAIGNLTNNVLPYTNNIVSLQENDCIYLLTDGYADQFGGPKGKKMMRKLFEDVLVTNSDKNMLQQKIALENNFKTWKGDLEQVDDICIIGIKL